MRWLEKNAKNIWSYIRDGQHVIIMENEKKLRKVSSFFIIHHYFYYSIVDCLKDSSDFLSPIATSDSIAYAFQY